ncbi:MAG: radical SAM protein [Candidatus Diapherotrites archaeon]|nr:radical SAM protein [Candidatus Diapherotrites archaeon]
MVFVARPSFTNFGEERIQFSSNFGIDITPRCQFKCSFCFQDGRFGYGNAGSGKDTTFEEFKGIIDQIRELGRITGKEHSICVAGGEPFLNKDAPRMISYACGILGRKNVAVTTNYFLFSKNSGEVKALLEKCGRPRVNLSIDREHLRFDRQAPEKLKAIFSAIKSLGSRATVISVATNAYEKRHPWPAEISRIIPKEVRKESLASETLVRDEFYRGKRGGKVRQALVEATKGKPGELQGYALFGMGVPIMPGLSLPVNVVFSPDGKSYLFGQDYLYTPQLSLGSWKRESLRDILGKNLPFKMNMLKGWVGARKAKERVILGGKYFGVFTEEPDLTKTGLFAKQALRRFDAIKLKRSGRRL